MIKEEYVSFEIAKLLKYKGFDQNCATYYLDGQVWRHYHGEVIPKDKQIYAAPTQSMAMKWFREVHNIHIIAEPCLGEGNEPNLSFNRWFWTILKEEGEYKPIRRIDEFPTYEKACEAAIKHCLEHLI